MTEVRNKLALNPEAIVSPFLGPKHRGSDSWTLAVMTRLFLPTVTADTDTEVEANRVPLLITSLHSWAVPDALLSNQLIRD